MCLQCLADAQNVFRNRKPILPKTEHNPPVWLMQSHYGHEDWPKEWFGLVFQNDPFAVWEWEPTPEPHVLKGKGEKADAAYEKWQKWYTNAKKAAESLDGLDLTTAFDLVAACIEAGYDRAKDGDVALWLMDYIGKKLARSARSTEKDWDEPAFDYQKPRGRPKKPGYVKQ